MFKRFTQSNQITLRWFYGREMSRDLFPAKSGPSCQSTPKPGGFSQHAMMVQQVKLTLKSYLYIHIYLCIYLVDFGKIRRLNWSCVCVYFPRTAPQNTTSAHLGRAPYRWGAWKTLITWCQGAETGPDGGPYHIWKLRYTVYVSHLEVR